MSQHKGRFVLQKYGRKENYVRKERGWPSISARSCRGMSLRKRTGCCHTVMPLSSSLKYGLQALSITLCAEQNTHRQSKSKKIQRFTVYFWPKKAEENQIKSRIWLYSKYTFTVRPMLHLTDSRYQVLTLQLIHTSLPTSISWYKHTRTYSQFWCLSYTTGLRTQ